jgi:hypothetical protein
MPPKKSRDAGLLDVASRCLHTGGTSIQGLSQIFELLDGTTIQRVSRSALNDANREVFGRHSFVEQLPLHDGSSFAWELLDPNLWLTSLVGQSPVLHEIFRIATARFPPSEARPWRLVLGFDEFAPGNKLQTDNRPVHNCFRILQGTSSHLQASMLIPPHPQRVVLIPPLGVVSCALADSEASRA